MLKTYFQTDKALGSEVALTIVGDFQQPVIDELFRKLWVSIFTFEKQFSRFLPASELSAFNRGAGLKQNISLEFRSLLLAAKDQSKSTAGLYNPFILPTLQKVGYSHSLVKGHEKDAVDMFADRTVVTINKLEVGDTWASIPYGTALDMGGLGKGYLADQLAHEVTDRNPAGFWFSLGGDIVVSGINDRGEPWTVGIEEARRPGQIIGEVSLPNRKLLGIATSGTTHRRGVKDGQPWHHIIDPRTLQPAETDVLQATVCASTVLEADVYAKCAVILGSKAGIKFLKSKKMQAALLQYAAAKNNQQAVSFGKLIHKHGQA